MSREFGDPRNFTCSKERKVGALSGHILWPPKLLISSDKGGLTRVVEKAMAPYSSTLARKIQWMEEPGRLQSMGSLRVGHD